MLWASCVNTHENTLKVGASHLSGPLAWTLPQWEKHLPEEDSNRRVIELKARLVPAHTFWSRPGKPQQVVEHLCIGE